MFAGIYAVAAHLRDQTDAGLVLRSNFWITASVTPLGWLLPVSLAMGVIVMIVWATHQG